MTWETLQLPEVVVLGMDQANPRSLTTSEFVAYVNDYGKGQDPDDGFRLPFRFYYVGKTPVAVAEWYLP